MKERYRDVNENQIKLLGKVWVDVEHSDIKVKFPLLITKRNDIGVNWLKQLPITFNKI